MDAKTHIESSSPNRDVSGRRSTGCHVTGRTLTGFSMQSPQRVSRGATRPDRGACDAPRRHAIVRRSGVASDLSGCAEISKTPPYKNPDLKPAGQYIDKQREENDVVPPVRKPWLENGPANRSVNTDPVHRRECRTEIECTMAENVHQTAWLPDRVPFGPAGRALIAAGAGCSGRDVESREVNFEKRPAAELRGPAFGSGYHWTFAPETGPALHGAMHPSGRSG
jgi:hypothetical protein